MDKRMTETCPHGKKMNVSKDDPTECLGYWDPDEEIVIPECRKCPFSFWNKGAKEALQ